MLVGGGVVGGEGKIYDGVFGLEGLDEYFGVLVAAIGATDNLG